ncbi:tumor necrosis factor receptor superfamily member 4 [Entelurus aequoreus]|uniref:tumor necrosis factor receptor superfamily member 4 n=1 Tax=Entelurus aequoreus TaxID=161455 RepID=UPI002B1DC874|nr:tumor necrosis factor receptor superfamily member 4 [Entelurus aequoreus]
MLPLKVLLLSLTFHQLFGNLDAAFSCPKGQRINVCNRNQKCCQACPDGYYQPEQNHSKQCKPCTRCNEASGSEVKEKCTKQIDTQCRCRRGFSPVELDSATCECALGFGLKQGECSKCEHGFFSPRPNTPCSKWKECKSGVNVNGSSTSDMLCNGEPKTPNTTMSVVTNVELHRPQSPNHIHHNHDITKATTDHYVPSKGNMQPTQPPNLTRYHVGISFLIIAIVGLLVLTVVTCKMHVKPCVRRQPTVQPINSLCRRPVEESGDGSRSALKIIPEDV